MPLLLIQNTSSISIIWPIHIEEVFFMLCVDHIILYWRIKELCIVRLKTWDRGGICILCILFTVIHFLIS
jgi:hypothetical protein